jgi:hypothetical protein
VIEEKKYAVGEEDVAEDPIGGGDVSAAVEFLCFCLL